jgi:hypothetical protein
MRRLETGAGRRRDGQLVRLAILKEGYVPYDKEKSVFASDSELHTFLLISRAPELSSRRQQPKQEDPSLSVNYHRLFGAQQAPLIFANMYLGQDPDSSDSLSNYQLTSANWQPPIMHFWDTWEYKNAKPLRGRVWRELFSDDSCPPIMGLSWQPDPRYTQVV